MFIFQTAPDAQHTLALVLQHYETLTSFSMTIRHENSSRLFPGVYTQVLRWKRDRFDLTVTRRAKYAKDAKPLARAPNYIADGFLVKSIWPDKHITTGPLIPPANSMPGWEVSGGPILTFLQRTPNEHTFEGLQPNLRTRCWFGSQVRWQGQPVREVVMSVRANDQDGPEIHWILADKTPRLLGMEVRGVGPSGSATYADQKENAYFPRAAQTGRP